MSQHKYQGFTLIEILVALAVYAIIALVAASSLNYAFQIRNKIARKADQINALQMSLLTVTKSIQQMSLGKQVYNDGQLQPVFIGSPESIEFTANILPNPGAVNSRSSLLHVAYLCQKSQFIQRLWTIANAPSYQQFEDKPLLDSLAHCKFAYLDQNLQVYSEWRPRADQPLPKAIQITWELTKQETLVFLIALPFPHFDYQVKLENE